MTVVPISTRLGNLAAEASSFVGRTAEMAALETLIQRGERLLTLVGGAGAGKTRLARRCAARLGRGALPGGTWFCDLTEARTRGDLVADVSAALDVPMAQGTSTDRAEAQLGRALCARPPLLLVLDNFEQLPADAARAVAAWHRDAPRAVFLVTSRARLRLEGEQVVEVGPLQGDEALALFEQRARRILPSFSASNEAEALRELAQRLDGSPLAIELAAARFKVLPPRMLLERLRSHLDVLTSTHRDASPRHASLRSALDGTWDLLAPWEQGALAQCSVFHGGFTLEAAEQVLDRAGAPAGTGALEALEALDDRSLLVRDEAPGGALRFRLFELVREHAAEKLAQNGARRDAVVRRHAAHYLAAAERDAAESLAPWATVVDARVARELDNLAAAARRAEAAGDAATLVRAALCLDPALLARGPAEEHRRLLDVALAASDDARVSPPARARLLAASANAHRVRGELVEAAAEIRRALGDAAALEGAPRDEALVQTTRAHLDLDVGNLGEARAAAQQALAAARRAGERRLEVVTLHTLARALVDSDALGEGRAVCLEAMGLAARADLGLVQSRLENLLGVIAARNALPDEAERYYASAHARARELGDVYLSTTVGMNLADMSLRRGDHRLARERYLEALDVARRLGFLRVEGLVASHLGLLEQDGGDAAAGREWHARALGIHREIGNVRSEAYGLEVAALSHLEEGAYDEARTLLERALELADNAGIDAVIAAGAGGLATVLARLGDADGARASLARAAAAAQKLARPEPSALVALHDAMTALALASTPDELTRARHRAQAELAATAPIAAQSPRARVVRRALAAAVESTPAAADAADAVHASATETLQVGPEARWFRRGDADAVDLSKRRALRLLLQALANAHASSSGSLSLDALFEAGWPAERIGTSAAHRRVYTAVGMLRDLGLRDALVRRDDGYLLTPGVRLARSAAAVAPVTPVTPAVAGDTRDRRG